MRRLLAAACLALMVLPAVGAATPARAAEVTVSEQARTLFREGVGLLKTKPVDYAAAYDKFRAAYADSPSPKILGNLGLCAMSLERDGEAIEAYERYLRDAPGIRPRERFAIGKDLRRLKKGVAQLTLRFEPAMIVMIDERLAKDGSSVVNRYQLKDGERQVGLRAGRHKLRFEADDFRSEEVEIILKKGDQVDKTVQLQAVEVAPPVVQPSGVVDEPEQDEGGGIPAGVWVGAGITGALAIGAGVTGGLTLANKSSFDDALAMNDLARARDLRDEGQTLALTTDVLLGATAAAAVATVVMIFVLPSDPDAGEDQLDSEARLQLYPSGWATSTAGGAALVGSF